MKPHPVSEPQNRKESPGLHGPIHAVAPAMVACHQQTLSHAGQCPVLPPPPSRPRRGLHGPSSLCGAGCSACTRDLTRSTKFGGPSAWRAQSEEGVKSQTWQMLENSPWASVACRWSRGACPQRRSSLSQGRAWHSVCRLS